MDDAIASVSARFKAKDIALPPSNEWLVACVECFFNMKPAHSPLELFEFAYEQWTLADLADVNSPSLPSACKSCNKIILPGKYAVQVNYLINVAVPFHKQLQEIRRPDASKNLEVDNERQERERLTKNVCSRLMKLEITDGVTTVIGIECSPIPAITRCVPGEKLLLIGPIEARRGALFLKPENIKMLGGEVDTLLICNAMENVLARYLNEPENPDPYKASANGIPEPSSATSQMAPPPSQRTQPSQASGRPESRGRIPAVFQDEVSQASNVSQGAVVDMTEMLDDGEDEIFASLTEALVNESLPLEEFPSSPQTSVVRLNEPSASRSLAARTSQKKPDTTKKPPSKLTQPTLSGFLSQRKPPEHMIDFTSDMNVFDDDFDVPESLEGHRSGNSSGVSILNESARLRKELEESFNRPVNGVSKSIATSAKTPDSKAADVVQKKRKDPSSDLETFGKAKIPRSAETRLSVSGPSNRNPERVSMFSESNTSSINDEPQVDWIPPPKKANLELLRPSHEQGKILIDYTDSATLDLNLFASQQENSKADKSHRPVEKPTSKPIDFEPFPPKEFPCRRTLRGKVVQMNKLKISNSKWQLSAQIVVKGVQLEVDFSPESVNKLLTVSCEEIERQRPHFAKDPELKQKYNECIKRGQERARNLDCEMEIFFKNFITKPTVIDVFIDV